MIWGPRWSCCNIRGLRLAHLVSLGTMTGVVRREATLSRSPALIFMTDSATGPYMEFRSSRFPSLRILGGVSSCVTSDTGMQSQTNRSTSHASRPAKTASFSSRICASQISQKATCCACREPDVRIHIMIKATLNIGACPWKAKWYRVSLHLSLMSLQFEA